MNIFIITIIKSEGLSLTEAVVQRCSVKKVFLEISQKFTGKHLCQSLSFLLKLQA